MNFTMNKNNPFIKNLVAQMSIEEKIGALLTLGFAGTVPQRHIFAFVEKYHCGGLRLSCDTRVFGSYVDPSNEKAAFSFAEKTGCKYESSPPCVSASEYKAVLDSLQAAARRRRHSIPLHFSFDQEGGTSADFSFGGVNIFPKPMGIRATNDVNIAYEVARATAAQSLAVGFNWIHSPVLDVNSEPKNPEIYTRAYSDNADEVSEYAIASCRGFKDGKMIATGKHFPGRGHSDSDAHFGLPTIDVDYETLQKRELLPYKKLIEQDLLPSIMVAHSMFPALDTEFMATVSKKILTGLLREQMGFEGVIATDSMTMGAIAKTYGVANACAMSLAAGADLVLMKAETSLVDEVFAAIRAFVDDGRIPLQELDEKVYRVLQTKYEYGLFGHMQDTDESPQAVINRPGIRALAALVARRSVLIARQEASALPLARSEKILVVEQKVKHYNTMQWHSGILYEQCQLYGDNVRYLETDYTYDESDKQQIIDFAQEADTIVFTNYFIRGKRCNTSWISDFIKTAKQKIILITNTPYEELSIPENALNVIVTFASSPENVRVCAGTLFGEMHPEGVWPLSKPLAPAKKR